MRVVDGQQLIGYQISQLEIAVPYLQEEIENIVRERDLPRVSCTASCNFSTRSSGLTARSAFSDARARFRMSRMLSRVSGSEGSHEELVSENRTSRRLLAVTSDADSETGG